MMESMKIWEHLEAELESDIGLVREGSLYVAQTREDLAMMESSAAEAHKFNLEATLVTAEEGRRIAPVLQGPFLGGLYCPGDGHVDPVKATLGYADAARKYGAAIYTGCTARAVETADGRVAAVVTQKGRIRTPVAVNTAGVWAKRVADMVGFHFPIKVVRFSTLETGPQPLKSNVFIRAPLTIFKQYADGRIRFTGGYHVKLNYDVGPDAVEDLGLWLPRLKRFHQSIKFSLNGTVLKRESKRVFLRSVAFPANETAKVDHGTLKRGIRCAYELMPFLKDIPITKRFAGYIALSPDMLPTIGELDRPKGFIMAAGWSGHGFALGPITGRLITDIIADGKPSLPLEAFRPSRFAEGRVSIPARFFYDAGYYVISRDFTCVQTSLHLEGNAM
jgi:glycine/D-amino acid oxidase-like deaminating enzyme